MLRCLVYIEKKDEEIADASLRLTARLQRFRGWSEVQLIGVVFGDNDISHYLNTFGGYGFEQIYQIKKAGAVDQNAKTSVIWEIIRNEHTSLIIFPGTQSGRELAALLAAQLNAGAVQDSQEIILNKGNLEVVVEVYNRQYQQISLLEGNYNIAVMSDIDPGYLEPSLGKPCRLTITNYSNTASATITLLESFKLAARELDIEEADLIVGIGRGVETQADLNQIQELAVAMDAAIAGTRPAVDVGFIPFSRQIGQTGRIVKPKLYFAVGISGAPQHITGVIQAKIIAINNDPKAPILRLADLGAVGDLREVVPILINRLKEINQKDANLELAGMKVERRGDE